MALRNPEFLAPQTDYFTLNGKWFSIHTEEPDFKDRIGRRAQDCLKHAQADGVEDQLDAFIAKVAQGVEDNSLESDTIIRFQLRCAGCSLLGRCGLEVVQYDLEGNEIVSQKITD
jgi:hypothetical protein